MNESKKKKTPWNIAFSAICIFLIIALSIILIGNITFIIKGALSPDTPPTVFGVVPLVALSGSMEGDMEDSFGAGSMVIMKKVSSVQVGDIVAYREPTSKDELVIITHRVVDVQVIDGEPRYFTQGDANNTPDMGSIGNDDLIAEYVFHIEGLGNFALFLREPIGMLLFIGLPILLFIIYDIVRRKIDEKKKAARDAELAEELAKFRAMAEETMPADAAPASDAAKTESAVESVAQ